MALILKSSGFKNLESLKDFSNRFPNVNCWDSDLDKIWVCHINCNDIPEFDDFELHNKKGYYSLYKKVLEKMKREENFTSQLTEFSASIIFDKIYSYFKYCLTNYLFTKCYLFYNWGVNAFEPITDHFKIHKQIEKYQKLKPKRLCRRSSNLIFNHQNSEETNEKGKEKEKSYDLFGKATGRSEEFTSRKVTFKTLKTTVDKTDKFFDYPKNSKNPFQETFSLKKVLYDMKQRPQWSENHILSKGSVDDLIVHIIEIPVISNISIQSRLLNDQKNWVLLKELLGIFLEQHKAIEKNNGYGRILKSHLKSVSKPPNRRLISVPKPLVCSYMVDILRRVLPFELFGKNRLRKDFFSNVTKLINSSKEENFIWYSFLCVLLKNKADLNWCTQIGDNYAQSLMILRLFKFIITHFVFNLLKNNFYITETGTSGFGLRFYQKCDMESTSFLYINSLLFYRHIRTYKRRDHDVFTLERKWLEGGVIDDNDLQRKPKKFMSDDTQYKQPIASVRFLPKKDNSDELRIITYIPKKNRQRVDDMKLENLFRTRSALRKKKLFLLKLLLQFLIDKIGFGIKPLPSNPKLEAAWYKALYLKEKFGKLYFVKADIADAFDSVKHDVLISELKKSLEVDSTGRTIQLKRIIEWNKEKGKIQKSVRFSFSNRPKENSIMISRSVFLHHKKRINHQYSPKFLDILKQVVTEQRLEIKGKVYKLIKGLAQGSAGKFSPQLCEIYYSSMDRQYFDEVINSKDSVFLRGVDDYLMITSNVGKARRFLEIVQYGIEPYGVRFNQDKLQSNLIQDIHEIPYLGLLFNFADMTVRPNYSRYRGRDFLTSMTLLDNCGNAHFNKKLFLQRKAQNIKWLKLHQISLNKSYNSMKVIRQTVFQASLLLSLRILKLAKYLFKGNLKNDTGVYEVLMKSCDKIKNLIKPCCLSQDEIKWLFLFGAFKITQKYSGQYKTLLLIFRFLLWKCEKSFINNETELLLNFLKKDVLDEMFWEKSKDVFGKLDKPKINFY